jgi:hypothetical protein
MQPTVRIAFDLSLAGAGNFFTLDDPIKGQLDNVGFPLAGEVYEDVSDSVRSVSVNRGRPRELTAFTAGQASVVLDNRARLFDPTAGTAVSPYSLGILPRKAIAIDIAGEPVFNGVVEDWDLQFSLDGDAITTAKSTDGFTLLAGETVTPGTATPEGSGVRVDSILDDVDWPTAKRRIDTGVASLGADVIADNTTALSYLQTIDVSEGGALFIAKDGSIEFVERTVSQGAAIVSFTDDGAGVPFSDISLEYGTESLFTQVSVEYVGGTAVATAGTAAVNNYGLTVLEIKTLLADIDEADEIAGFYLLRYSEPQVRINQLEVRMDGLSVAQQSQVLSLELGDPVDVVFTPQGIGDPIERVVVVDQIEHNITPADHVVRFNFSQTLGAFVLDVDRLDEGRLGFA